MALTYAAICTAKTRSKAHRLADGSGLFLWVTPAGGTLWLWKYRHDGKEKLMSFGAYPAVTLALARARHIDARKLLETGIDPMEQRKADKVAQLTLSDNSFQSDTSRWPEHWKNGNSPRHAGYVK